MPEFTYDPCIDPIMGELLRERDRRSDEVSMCKFLSHVCGGFHSVLATDRYDYDEEERDYVPATAPGEHVPIASRTRVLVIGNGRPHLSHCLELYVARMLPSIP